jgi:drug/metabolite transporter (DMT)-like permease
LRSLVFAIGLAVVVELVGGGLRWPAVSITGLLSVVGSGLLYYTAAYWSYLSVLRKVPASLAATSFYLIPVFGVAASFGLLGERLVFGQWVGVGIVVVAVVSIIRLPTGRATTSTMATAPVAPG